MKLRTQTHIESQCDTGTNRVAPLRAKNQRYLNPIQLLELRLAFVLSRELTVTELARLFQVSRRTIDNQTTRRGLGRDDPMPALLKRLAELWKKEAPTIYLRSSDFIAIVHSLVSRRDQKLLDTAKTTVARTFGLPLNWASSNPEDA
jgi:hypothetical protein